MTTAPATYAYLVGLKSFLASNEEITARKSKEALVVGAIVEKKFKSKWRGETITDADVCASAAAPMWTVTYDDGDAEDLYEYELRKILCD